MDIKPDEILPNTINNELDGAGTTKRKELHGTVQVRALSGTWRDKPNGAVFHSYKIDFSCDSQTFSGFILLTESKLDHDVANAKMDLYLHDTTAKASVSSSVELLLDFNQIKKAMCFHELLFNGLFGKLFVGSKSSGTSRVFLLKDGDLLWNTGLTYLILPIESVDPENHDSWKINWQAIDSCVTVVEFVNMNTPFLENEKCADENTLILANGSFPMESVKDTVVMSIHTGRIYYVLDILLDTSAYSPFEANRDGTPSKHSSFADYFDKTYEIKLLLPGQPLLLLKQTHNPYNLLSNTEAQALCRKLLSNVTNQKPQNHVHMPPELVVIIDIPLFLLKTFYLIPSVMHRLECLMLASQLREEIALNEFNIPSLLLLEALTTQRCCEDFSSERLELLGDSVLKYSVSCHLFLTNPEKDEGKLSSLRQQVICNANLHSLGIKKSLHEYIRDTPFDPRRWVAPGQLSIHPSPCLHEINSYEIPLERKYQSIDENLVLGKSCDLGHRWMVSKSVSDCVEALIGAYYVAGGLIAARHVMKWLGLDVELDLTYVDKFADVASDWSNGQNLDELTTLETKLGYDFSTKGLLLEAITHPTKKQVGPLKYCYERLEFLGDAVLDLLITWHLYQSHLEVDPGKLTDLRSASVNNENFSQVAVKRDFYPHLQHSCVQLSNQISKYVNLITKEEDVKTLQGNQCPKALGDLVESIAGGILIDSKLQIEEVWRVFYPLLSPIVTPDNLELPPFRELNELCDGLGYFFKEHSFNHNQTVISELRLQLKDILLIGEGIGRTKKSAKGEAAFHLLKDLENRGISYSRFVLNKRKRDLNDNNALEIVPREKQKVTHLPSKGVPVISSINTSKGGPRMSLYDLCKRFQWPMPNFETIGHQSRSPIEFKEGLKGFNSFKSKISLCIPDFGVVQATGEERADKKSSQDSASLSLLHELENQGKIVIGSA